MALCDWIGNCCVIACVWPLSVLQMWLCRGNGAQVHNSERDQETRATTGGTAAFCAVQKCLLALSKMLTESDSMSCWQAIKVVQYNINTEELYAILKEFIHLLYFRWGCFVHKCLNARVELPKILPFVSFRHLLVNPRDRRVVIIESILCPSHFRETLTKVFFKQFEVSTQIESFL